MKSAATRERREYEKVALAAARKTRQLVLYWARRCRKSTNLGAIMFDELSKGPGRMAIAASASLLLGKELVTVTLSQAEQALVVSQEAETIRTMFTSGADSKGLDLKVADAESNKLVTGITPEDFSSMYRASRLELRLYFDKTRYSRLQVIAPNPATARSWRALVVRDEVGYTSPQFETALQIATDAMMRDTPDLKMIYASNLSQDDRHPFFSMTLPRDISAPSEEEQFPANPRGHLYVGQTGLVIHRVALKDAYAAGHRLYDDSGKAMTYDEARRFGPVKLGWDISYALNHKAGGAAVIDLIALITAQQKGASYGCKFIFVQSDEDFRLAIAHLRSTIGDGAVAVGFDVASTTNETSNPSSVTVMEDVSGMLVERLIVAWKEKGEAMQRERIGAILKAIQDRSKGGAAKRLTIDGSNERLFAQGTAVMFRDRVPVDVIVSGETVEPCPPGYEATGCNYKTYLGDLYSTSVNDGRVAVPADGYVKDDHRLVMKDGGRFVCTPEPDGKHGDTFDSGKLAEYGHVKKYGATQATAMPTGSGILNTSNPRDRMSMRPDHSSDNGIKQGARYL